MCSTARPQSPWRKHDTSNTTFPQFHQYCLFKVSHCKISVQSETEHCGTGSSGYLVSDLISSSVPMSHRGLLYSLITTRLTSLLVFTHNKQWHQQSDPKTPKTIEHPARSAGLVFTCRMVQDEALKDFPSPGISSMVVFGQTDIMAPGAAWEARIGWQWSGFRESERCCESYSGSQCQRWSDETPGTNLTKVIYWVFSWHWPWHRTKE